MIPSSQRVKMTAVCAINLSSFLLSPAPWTALCQLHGVRTGAHMRYSCWNVKKKTKNTNVTIFVHLMSRSGHRWDGIVVGGRVQSVVPPSWFFLSPLIAPQPFSLSFPSEENPSRVGRHSHSRYQNSDESWHLGGREKKKKTRDRRSNAHRLESGVCGET